MDQLTDLGLRAEAVTHVIITHRHWDHFNGSTFERDGHYLPQFPKATHYLGRADWDRAQPALENPASVEARTLKVLHDHGVLTLVAGDCEVVAGIQIFAAPGETPGHQIVRVQSAGQTCYGLGDLYRTTIRWNLPIPIGKCHGPNRSQFWRVVKLSPAGRSLNNRSWWQRIFRPLVASAPPPLALRGNR